MAASLCDSNLLDYFALAVQALWQKGGHSNTQDQRPIEWGEALESDNSYQSIAHRLVSTANTCLAYCGVPNVGYTKLDPTEIGAFAGGHFSYSTWTVHLGITDARDELVNFREFCDYATLVYHECRHAEQFYRIAQFLMSDMASGNWKASAWRQLFKEYRDGEFNDGFFDSQKIKNKYCPQCGWTRPAEKDLNFCEDCGSHLVFQDEYTDYKGFKEQVKYIAAQAAGNDPRGVPYAVHRITSIPWEKTWSAWSDRGNTPATISTENAFAWYNSVYGVNRYKRKLVVDKIYRDQAMDFTAEDFSDYQNLPEEEDAFYIQGKLQELLCKKITGNEYYDWVRLQWTQIG